MTLNIVAFFQFYDRIHIFSKLFNFFEFDIGQNRGSKIFPWLVVGKPGSTGNLYPSRSNLDKSSNWSCLHIRQSAVNATFSLQVVLQDYLLHILEINLFAPSTQKNGSGCSWQYPYAIVCFI